MNRGCKHDGCKAHGGDSYMDAHEAQLHARCTCGEWIGNPRNFTHHVGWAVRRGGIRETHQLLYRKWDGIHGSPGDPSFIYVDALIDEVKRLTHQLQTVNQITDIALGSVHDHNEGKAYITEASEAIEQLADLAAQVRAFR